MKFILLLSALLSLTAQAETIAQANTRREMIGRTDALIDQVALTRKDLEDRNVMDACAKIKSILVVYPEHLKGMGNRMSIFNKKNTKAQDLALKDLMTIHEQSVICDQGDSCEHVDPDKLDRTLKSINKNLQKNRSLIKKSSVGYNNDFSYSYDF